MKRTLLCALCSVLLLAAAGPASAEILLFDLSGQIGETDPIPDSYGDITVGSDTLLDVTYREVVAFGDSADADDLRYQTSNYGDLVDVAYGGTNPSIADSVGEIRFAAAPGRDAQLFSFDLAGFDGEDQYYIDVQVYDEAWNLLVSWDDLTIPGDTSIPDPCFLTLTLDPPAASSAVILQWQSPWYVGIDNVHYDVTVPEPATMVGWVIGLGCLGYVACRRRGRKG